MSEQTATEPGTHVSRGVAALRADKSEATVDTVVWKPAGAEYPGCSVIARRKDVREVWRELAAIVGEYPEGGEEYFNAYAGWRADHEGKDEWPDGRIQVFAIRGANEGDYVRVEVVNRDTGKSDLLLLAKTFQGRSAAWGFAKYLADLLGA